MKKPITYILAAVTALSLTGTAGAVGENDRDLTNRQDEVHAAAELLRELGVADNSEAIRALSDEWWRCESLLNAKPLGTYWVTGYDPFCAHCCGKTDGITASGVVATPGYTVAMCKDFPFGTKIYIEGLGVFEVQDRGVGAGKVDVACVSHAACADVTGKHNVWILDDEKAG